MEKSKDRLFLQVAVYLALVLIFFVLPPIGTITPEGMRLTGLFIAFIYGLTITGDAWPALLTLALFPLTGVTNLAGVLTASFGSDVCIFVMLSLVLVAYMEYSGAAAYAATWLLKRRILKGHPWRLLFMLLFICWLLSSFVNAIAGMMLIWAFLYEIFAQFGYKPFDKFPSVVMLGTCAVGGLGLSTLPWGNNSIVILSAFTNTTGLDINYFLYMGYSIPYSIMVILGFLLIMRFLFHIQIDDLKNFDPATLSAESQVLTVEKVVALLSMAALVLLILIPSCFPADSAIALFSKKFGLSGKLLVIFAVLQIIRIKGKPACPFVQIAKNGISWKLMLVVADVLVFSSLIGTDAVGINLFLADALAPSFAGRPALLFIVLAAVVTVICTNFMVNKIIAVLMISITMPIAAALGIDQVQLACLYTIICTVAFMLPSASQSATVLFSNTEWVRAADVYKYGLPVIVMMTALQILWNLVYFRFF